MENSKTRLPFRVLAGLIGLFLLCVAMPIALIDPQLGFWERIFVVMCCIIAGIGLLTGSCSGRWFNSSAR